MDENELSNRVIGAAIEVHKHLGPGLLEAVYRDCLAHELTHSGIFVEREVAMSVRYEGIEIAAGYRADLIIEKQVIVELKAVDGLQQIFTAQLLSYLRMSGHKLGMLINFNVAKLADGIKRVVNNL